MDRQINMVPHSLNYESWKQRKEAADDLKPIYTTNAIESLNMPLRKVPRVESIFQVTKPCSS
mgnify:CR=1 FL=1